MLKDLETRPMTITKVSSKSAESKTNQDKTDWNKIYNKPQSTVDREAAKDSENPVLSKSRFKRINDKQE